MATSVAKTPSPSAFAKLLRRSRFATYDPKIGQIYTTYGGHAHRGDWGVKRALGNRRRDGRITLQAIDTIYQQTEWESAYNSAKWMKKFSETETVPAVESLSSWTQYAGNKSHEWLVDSDFAPLPFKEAEKTEQSPEETEKAQGGDAAEEFYRFAWVPNTSSMHERQFKGYVKHVRKLRPEFQAFLQEQVAQGRVPQHIDPTNDLSRAAKDLHMVHNEFLAKHVNRESSKASDKVLRVPHAVAGSTYTHMPPLQQLYFAKPLPGRRLAAARKERTDTNPAVAVAGWVGMEVETSGEKKDKKTYAKRDKIGRFRPVQSALQRVPRTVGARPETLAAAGLRLHFQDWSVPEALNRNPYTPGSMEYVLCDEYVQDRLIQGKMERGESQVNRLVIGPTSQDVKPSYQGIDRVSKKLKGMVNTDS